MIEKDILNYLKSALQVDCFMEVPSNPPAEFILIEKTGTSRNNFVNGATIAVQSYSTSLYKAASLNEEVKKAMDDLIVLDNIGSSKLNSDYNFTDTSTKKYRYQAVYDVVHY